MNTDLPCPCGRWTHSDATRIESQHLTIEELFEKDED